MRAPEPLNPEQLQRLWRWERQMVRFHAAAMTVLMLCAGAAYFLSDATWLRRSLLVLIVLLVGVATVLQFRERCPRCGSRLRTKSLLRLPERCSMCGVPFERPPAA